MIEPVAGRAVRFLHTADWQLGMTRYFLDGDAQPRYSSARIDVIARIGALAAAQRCQFVLVCGDVFETNAVSPRVVGRALEALAAVPMHVYLLPGNHDPLDASSVFRSKTFRAAQPDHVHVLDGRGPTPVAPGVEIVAAPWRSKRPVDDPIESALADLPPAPGLVRILAAHGGFDALNQKSRDPRLLRLGAMEEAVASGVVDFVALGDRHSVTSVGQTGRIYYPGTPEVTDFDETDPGQVLVVELAPGAAPAVTPHRVGEWKFKAPAMALNSASDVETLTAMLTGLASKDRTVVRLNLTGSLTLAQHSRLDESLGLLAETFASLQVWGPGSELVVTADADDLQAGSMDGFAGSAARELTETAGGPGEPALAAQQALMLLHRLVGAAS